MVSGHSQQMTLFMVAVAVFDCLLALAVALVCSVLINSSGDIYATEFYGEMGYWASFILLWPFVASRNRLFISRRRDPIGQVLADVLKAVLLSIIIGAFLLNFFITGFGISRVFLMAFGLGTFGVIVAFRGLLQVSLWSLRRRGFDTRQVLIIGANPRVKELLRVIRDHTEYGYNVIGVLEDEPDRCRMLETFNTPWLGKFDALEQILTRHVVDEVYIGLPVSSRYETIQSMAHLCEGVGVGVRMIADLFPLRLATSRFHKLERIPILALSTVPEHQGQLLMQRLTDIVISAGALLALSPVLLMTAIAIKLDSRGPVFFQQERVGQNQRRFGMLKFRSMVVNAEQLRAEVEKLNEADGPIFKARNDPRMTRVGRFIRKYSIDELPQLINVLKGEMSLVGPRPPLAKEVAQYSWNQRRRLSVKPGMTGLSQVRGRSDLSFRETVDFDLAYIDQWSLWLVIRILLLTIPAVVRGRGAI